MNKRQAIRDCKKLWRPVAEGKARNKPQALELHPEFHRCNGACPFCDYSLTSAEKKGIRTLHCQECPLAQQTGWDCFEEWMDYRHYPQEFASVIMALKD